MRKEEQLKQEAEEIIEDSLSAEDIDNMKFEPTFQQVEEMLIKIAEPREKRIAELEKENAELNGLVNQYKASKCCSISLVNRNMIMSDQLTKAKELLKQLLVHSKRYLWIADDCNKKIMQKEIGEAEQFLKDSEVEK